MEPVGKHLIPGVEMIALSKHYGGKHNPFALRNLSLKLYQGKSYDSTLYLRVLFLQGSD